MYPNFHNLKDLLLINSMINVITEPTRQHAILDPIIIPEDFPFVDSGVIDVPNNISDHKATYIKLEQVPGGARIPPAGAIS